jgi:signal transduction histidine kinase
MEGIAPRLVGDRVRVLLLEPHADHAAAAVKALHEADMRVEHVLTADSATERAALGNHDLWLLSDVGPGLPWLRAMRRQNHHTPALVVTSRGEVSGADALQAGASSVVDKLAGYEALLPALVMQVLLRGQAEHVLAPRLVELQDRVEQLERERETLKAHLRTRDQDLVDANRRAQEASSQRSQLLANVSHELRTPLTTILGFTGVLLDRASGPLTTDQDKQLELIKKASTQLLALINDVLDMSRLETGQADLVSLTVDLGALLRDVADPLRQLLVGREVAVVLTGSAPTVQSDPTRVRQILWNLCVAAARATQQGAIHLDMQGGPDGAVVTVKDTGPGLTAEELSVVFEKFHHLTPARKKARGSNALSTGLGLPLAADLARALGGKLEVESTLGLGTTFTLRLPQVLVVPPRQPR